MWKKLNETMLKHGFPKPNFKGFMIDNSQVNWNVIKIIYGSKDSFIKIVATLAFCSRPRQGLARVRAKREARESHLMFLGV
jgi:hypothetical protein